MDVKILGTGCANCRALENATREAVAASGREVAVEKIEEMAEIVEYGVLGLPALVVDGEVVVAGRVPDADEIADLLVAGA